MKFEKIVALVPMRHDSKRVPGKNYRPMCGKPLYAHIIETLLEVETISQVVVDTDSPPVIEGLTRDYPQVKVLIRPDELRADTTPTNEILVHDTAQVPADLYLQTHSTNPLLKVDTVRRAIEKLSQSFPEYDSLFGVTRLQTRLWDELGRAVNHNPAILLRTQDLPPIFEENSCIYLFTRETLLTKRNRLGERPMLFEIDAREATDIDVELDFIIAETLMRNQI